MGDIARRTWVAEASRADLRADRWERADAEAPFPREPVRLAVRVPNSRALAVHNNTNRSSRS